MRHVRQMTLKPGLYVTATPIGNLKDVTLRAIDTLREADRILCEDTRHTGKLLSALSINTPMAPYHEHNGEAVRPGILQELRQGASICLVSDAGTPLISDPGYKLVREARDEGIDIYTVPGASAFVAALSIAGAPSDRFFFAGFAPAKVEARKRFLSRLADIRATLIFYETGNRLASCLASMSEIFGPRRAAVARELTKLHEEVVEGDLDDLSARYAAETPKGEIVVMVHPPVAIAAADADIDAYLLTALVDLSVKDAAAMAAERFGRPKKELYARALVLKSSAAT